MTWDVMRDTDPGDYVVRGHVDTEGFFDAVEAFEDFPEGATLRLTGALGFSGDVAHGWFRFVPSTDPDDGGGAYWPAQPHSRGAFPVTYGTVLVLPPPPASDAALALGCCCPVLDRPGDGLAWMSGDCPLHGGCAMTDPMAALQAEMQAVCREALEAAWATRLAPLARALVVGRALRPDGWEARRLDDAISAAATRAIADAAERMVAADPRIDALARARAAKLVAQRLRRAGLDAGQTTMDEAGA